MDIKFKEIFDFTSKHLGEVYMVLDVIGNMLGKTPPEGAPPDKKGMYGLFGKEDERLFERLRLELEPEEYNKLTRFIRWHFRLHQRQSAVGAVTVWWTMNAWRTFAVKLSSSSKKVGTKEHTVTRKEDGKTFTDKTVEDIFKKPETNDSLEFLKRIIEIINKHPANEEAGFRAVVEYFEAAGVPKMPSEETIRFIEDEVLNFRQWYAIVATLPARASAAAENANKRIDRKDEERSRKLGGGIVNFLKKLI